MATPSFSRELFRDIASLAPAMLQRVLIANDIDNMTLNLP
jgi:hypothetical protein